MSVQFSLIAVSCMALATYSGQNYGAKKHERVIEGYKKSLILMTIFTIIMLPIMQFCGKWIMEIFVKDQPVIEMGMKALRISSIFYFFLGIIYVIRGGLNGIGNIWGIWWSVGIVWFISGFTAWLRYIGVKKKTLVY